MKGLIKIFLTILLLTASIGLTSCVANDENKIGDDKNISNIDLPEEGNGYIVKVVPGETAIIDLNGDGENEVINYALNTGDRDSNGYDYEVSNLTVAGVEYVKEDRDNPLEELGVYISYPDDQWYFIVDIDASDAYRELAIADLGPSDALPLAILDMMVRNWSI